MPPKRTTYEDKKRLIEAKDSGASVYTLVKGFDLPQSTVYNILKERKSIFDKIDEGIDLNMKRMKMAGNKKDEAALSWLKTQRSNNTPIKGPLIQEKAIAKELGDDDFFV